MIITLPLPPSVNTMFANVLIRGKQRRVKSAAYRQWSVTVAGLLRLFPRHHIPAPYGVHIRINVNRRSDIDNRVKAILDALVKAGVIRGDNWIDDCRVTRDCTVDACEVEIWPLQNGVDIIKRADRRAPSNAQSGPSLAFGERNKHHA